MRGGISYASKRYSKANNESCPSYDKDNFFIKNIFHRNNNMPSKLIQQKCSFFIGCKKFFIGIRT